MTSVLEPTWQNVLLCSILLIVSGVIILAALRRFRMRLATAFFSSLFFVAGIYIPFYFIGRLIMYAASANYNPTFCMYFLKNQLATLNAPFLFFESASMIACLLAIFAIAAIIIAAVFIVEIVVRAIYKACRIHRTISHRHILNFVCNSYIPNYHNTYLVLGRLRD